MRSLAKLVAVAGLLAVTSCTGMAVDACKYSAVRRQVYTAAITAADAYEASGRVVPPELALGRQAAQTALAVLNVNCPAR